MNVLAFVLIISMLLNVLLVKFTMSLAKMVKEAEANAKEARQGIDPQDS